MKTILEEVRTWFLETLSYDGELTVKVVEGIPGELTDLKIGEAVLEDCREVAPSAESRRVEVRFPGTVAWQVVDESYTTADPTEVQHGRGALITLSRSSYLDYVNAQHGWFAQMIGPGTLYRLLTVEDIIEVVATEPPVVSWAGE